jgi:hydroxypyruvate reductase
MNETLRQDALQIVREAIGHVMPDAAVRRALEGRAFPGRVVLIAAGKAAWTMADAAVKTLNVPADRGVVITK